ncbi:MAG TPA: MFS transporter [Steroidobacteraceae bacterium]|nr:MFS transporter [Steroidobacteraceae bacterium]
MSTPLETRSSRTATAPGAPSGQGAAERTELAWPRPAQAWYAVGVFALGLMFNFLDRGVIGLLVQPIEHDLHLNDTQVGLLMGPAFIIFYVVLGLPIARLVDSRSRRAIIGVGVVLWSLTTALCGLARSFGFFFLCRIGVGVGEACNGPATYSLMADLFPKERLARAISVMQFGFVAGSGISTLLAGAIISFVSHVDVVHVPLVGALRPWQVTFLAVGLPGLVVALLYTTIIEPLRRGRMNAPPGAGLPARRAIPLRAVARFINQNRTTYAPMFLSLALQSIVTFGILNWSATFFVRTYGWTIPQFALANGLTLLVLMPIGLIPGSMLAEHWTRQGRDDAHMRVTLLSSLAYAPTAIVFAMMPSAPLALTFLGLGYLVSSLQFGPINAAMQIVTPNEMRGQVTALYLFIFNTFGSGLAPLVIALVTNRIIGSEAKIGESIVLTAAVLEPLVLIIMWAGLKPYARSVARARAWA